MSPTGPKEWKRFDPSSAGRPPDDDGYRLWLRYDRIGDAARLEAYRGRLGSLRVEGDLPGLAAARDELVTGLSGLLGGPVREAQRLEAGALVVGTPETSRLVASLLDAERLERLGAEGFWLGSVRVDGHACTVIGAATERGALYGAFRLLQRLQTHQSVDALDVESAPRLRHRLLDHWDNLNGTIERGYAGFSLWDWHKLPDYLAPRYRDYARACASVGINGAVLTNVNADALVLTPAYLEKVAALAGVFRPYGVRVHLTARFSAPVELGGLPTADPEDARVVAFWRDKVREIYRFVPDFGGFLVKANSEGQPGPQNYGRSHADGANLLADALAEHGGIVMWRAFVYDADVPEDRAKQAYQEFVPLDGEFRENVCVQVKNGPIDFQPREPFHPLFGALEKTPVFPEFQLTQEYLGCATHLVYLGPLFEECLKSDTHARGPGSTVARVADGSLGGFSLTGMAAVANVGSDRNWCGHPFAAANWFAFGRFAWDPDASARAVGEEWLRATFHNDPRFVAPALELLMASREIVVNTMTPLGLHHVMARDHHYGPGPWVEGGRADWTSPYYHRADARGLGFDRTPTGSDALEQYAEPLRRRWGDLETCPEELLLWFHHVDWDHRMKSGRTLWEELCHRYQAGVDAVGALRRDFAALAEFVDGARFEHVESLLRIQEKEARWWRDACVLYFQTFSRRPLPAGHPAPERTLEEYRAVVHRFVPGNPSGT